MPPSELKLKLFHNNRLRLLHNLDKYRYTILIMSQKWNLQDIRPTTSRPERPTASKQPTRPQAIPIEKRREPTQQSQPQHLSNQETSSTFTNLPNIEIVNKKKRNRFKVILSIILIFFITGSAFGISFLTGGAIINIYPKNRSVTVNAEFSAKKERQPGELTYEILTLEATGERQVSASGQETVQTQSSGFIEITKTTPGAERLIKNTRFQTADGKIFRIQESVVVPGAVAGQSGEASHGRIRAEVFADDVGDSFNIPANQRFTVPGFQESNLTELFNAIYATNAEPFTGGFDGPRFIIDEAELATARQALQLELRNSLLEKLRTSIPVGFTTFESAIALTYSQLPAVQYGDSLVTIREQAVLQIPLFTSVEFASFLATETIVGYSANEGVRIANIEDLRFSYINPTTSQSNIANLSALEFKIVGNPQIVWTFDADDIRNSLAGKERTAHTLVLGKYPGIERSTIDIRPFWKRSFPDNAQKITLNEIIE